MNACLQVDNAAVNPSVALLEIRTVEDFDRADRASLDLARLDRAILEQMQAVSQAGNRLREEIRQARAKIEEAKAQHVEEQGEYTDRQIDEIRELLDVPGGRATADSLLAELRRRVASGEAMAV